MGKIPNPEGLAGPRSVPAQSLSKAASFWAERCSPGLPCTSSNCPGGSNTGVNVWDFGAQQQNRVLGTKRCSPWLFRLLSSPQISLPAQGPALHLVGKIEATRPALLPFAAPKPLIPHLSSCLLLCWNSPPFTGWWHPSLRAVCWSPPLLRGHFHPSRPLPSIQGSMH